MLVDRGGLATVLVGRSLCRLVDAGQSLWVTCCIGGRCGVAVGWPLWVGRCGLASVGWSLRVSRCGLVAMLVDRFVHRVVGRSLCRSVAVGRSLQARSL